MKKIYPLLLTGCLLLALLSCNKKDNGNDSTIDPVTLKVNTFIHDIMDEIYLWTDQMPGVDYKQESDPEAYFYKLLYTDDKWSYLTNNYEELMGGLTGNEVSFGYSLAFGKFTETNNYFAIVRYVYPNTPAAAAGFKRGDIIIKINNNDITADNYTDLIYASNLTVTMGILSNNTIYPGESRSMTAKKVSLNPVVHHTILQYGNHRIGYLFYTQYISDYNTALDNALQSFKSAGVTDVVLDLRYNQGGDLSAARHVCSALAPADVVNRENLLITKKWNSLYQKYWESNTQYIGQLQETFDKTVPCNLDLDKVYILTGQNTASASELTINSLKPYMNVVLIGGTTHGKYVASTVLQPKDWYENPDTGIENWAVMPIIYSFANANGVTDFKNGFAPDHQVDDNILDPAPLGDAREALLAGAIELITGITPAGAKATAARSLPAHTIIGQRTSRFDHIKGNLIETTPKR